MVTSCRIKNCENSVYSAGYCKKHYDYELKRGIDRRQKEDLS